MTDRNSPPEARSVRGWLQAAGNFLARQRHLQAVRDGIVGVLPLVLIGSLFLLLSQPPSAALQRWIAPYAPMLLVPYRMLGGLIAMYVAFTAAHSLAKSYNLDPLSSGLLAMAAYLVAAMPASGAVSGTTAVPSLPLQRLGSGGIFAALLIALGSVELTRFFVQRKWTIRLPSTAPEIVLRSFVALIPGLAIITVVFAITQLLRLDLVHALEMLSKPLLRATGSLPASWAVVLVDSGLWLLGVHATAALATLRPLWEAMLLGNMEAAAQGARVLPHIASQHFYLWFVWQGGSGATLPLALLLWRAQSLQLRSLGKIALVPAVCNINEPLLFGVPIVLNPELAIPFFAAPLFSATTAYIAFHLNWVTRPYLEMPWTLPAPLGAFFSTGGDYRAVFLELLNLIAGLLFYWPFARKYDLELLRIEREAKNDGSLGTLPSGSQTP